MKQCYQGSCHCGRVQFGFIAAIDYVRICECSVCRKRGALIHRVSEHNIRIFTPLSELTLYQWGTFTGQDYFCPTCGILPFRRPGAPTAAELAAGMEAFDGWEANARCLYNFDIETAPKTKISGAKL